MPSESCLSEMVCSLKGRMRGKVRMWTPDECRTVARAVLRSAETHRLHPALLLATMVNESSMDEKAVRVTHIKSGAEARDSGLMGIRCILDGQGRCTNGHVRGHTWRSVMDIATNIEMGALELASWRQGGAVERVTTTVKDEHGAVHQTVKLVPCHHKTHAYWAHYNHGPFYIDKGYARHYPHRVAVLYYAIARALNLEAPELTDRRITINDAGMRPRTPDRPVEDRYRELCTLIAESNGVCGGVVSSLVPRSDSSHPN